MTLEERQAVEARLAELTAKGSGRLTPEAVVEDAKSKRSPLHAFIFRESDQEAAHQRRLDLARQLIRSVRVVMTTDRRSISVVGYVHDPGTNAAGYVPTATLIDDHDRARETVLREFARIEGIIERSREVAAALGLDGQLEEMLAGIQRFVESARRAA